MVKKGGGVPGIYIMVEKRSGNKKVTKVSGLEDFLLDPTAVAGDCQRRSVISRKSISTSHSSFLATVGV
jgi:translation initiation factor 2D